MQDQKFRHMHTSDHNLLLTSDNDITVLLNKGIVFREPIHKEVDTITVQHMVAAAIQMSISVLSDDTGVFVLLLYDCFVQKLVLPVIIESPITVPKHASLSPATEAFIENIKQMHHQACTKFRSARHQPILVGSLKKEISLFHQ